MSRCSTYSVYLLCARLWSKCLRHISSHAHNNSGTRALSSPYDGPENNLVPHGCTACKDLGWDLEEACLVLKPGFFTQLVQH